ncbi:hypothetical protein KY285_000286 [Solanum tuberosum]|nr:hypothetical protein KY284_000325 [Solanum tuberosum]KAH0764415.1 hypothetical protein KY285_000286 [Solanum tuberosum]
MKFPEATFISSTMTKTEENNDSSRLGATKQLSPCPCIVRSIHVAPQGQVNRSKASIRPFLFRNGLEPQEKMSLQKGERFSILKFEMGLESDFIPSLTKIWNPKTPLYILPSVEWEKKKREEEKGKSFGVGRNYWRKTEESVKL